MPVKNFPMTHDGSCGLKLRQFGYEDCKPSHAYGPLARTYYLIHYVVSGTGRYTVNGKTYTVHPKEMFVIHPFEETYYEADADDPWNYVWIGFLFDGTPPLEFPYVIPCPEALSVFLLIKSCNAMSKGSDAFLSARLWDLFALLLNREKNSPDYVEYAVNCIHSEYANGITIEEIANRLNLDRTYLYTIFKRKTGISPKKYLLNYRMEIAASLLAEKKISISVIANSVGYGDIFSFSKMFKRHFGVSPREFREGKQRTMET